MLSLFLGYKLLCNSPEKPPPEMESVQENSVELTPYQERIKALQQQRDHRPDQERTQQQNR